MSDWKKLPFGIDFVVEQDLVPLGISKVKYSSGYSINCPFCAKNGLSPDRKHKYAIDIYKNVGHCFRCGSGHGMLSLHQALSKNPITLKEAEEDLLKRWNGLPSNVQIELAKVKERLDEENKSKLYPAPIEIRHQVYTKFLDQLTLSKKHHDDLIARGLSEEEIIKGKYKTVPVGGFKTFAENSLTYEIKDQLRRHRQWGIPGFYGINTDSVGVVALDNGYFVPVKDEKGYISGMQIRFDALPDNAPDYKKEHYAKYKWFTSNFKDKVKGCSASGSENIHYAGDWLKSPKQVILTEGVLKADVAAALSKKMTGKKAQPILGLVGVYNYEQLSFELAKLQYNGLEKVVLAVDMDYREKPQVAQAMNNIIEIIKKNNLKCEVFKWDPTYKGIDDYFLAICKKRTESF